MVRYGRKEVFALENKVTLSSFPSDSREALAILYVQSQDLSGMSPAEIEAMYHNAYTEIEQSENDRRDDAALCQVIY